MVAPLTIGPGIDIGSGISIGTTASFTITSSDISNPQLYYDGYSSYSSSGFTSSGTTQLYNGLRYDITSGLYSTISAAQSSASFNSSNAWVWHASFATGGNCLVRFGLVPGSPDYLVIAPIDESNTGWQSGSTSGPTLAGTFTFPATFTAYSPATQLSGRNNWC